MRVHFLGDVHGRYNLLKQIAKQCDTTPRCDLLIQTGDMGIFPNLHIFPEELPVDIPLWFIDGNHDHIPYLRNEEPFEGYEFLPRNMVYMPRGTLVDKNGVNFLFLGGGESIDRNHRTTYVDWFPEEIPTAAEYEAFMGNIMDADVVVTHSPPTRFMQHMRALVSPKFDNPVSRTLDIIIDNMVKRDKEWLWICSHMHPETVTYWNDREDNITFVCLPPIHDSEPGFRPFKSSSGIKVTL